jgi:hypothetical protein
MGQFFSFFVIILRPLRSHFREVEFLQSQKKCMDGWQLI